MPRAQISSKVARRLVDAGETITNSRSIEDLYQRASDCLFNLVSSDVLIWNQFSLSGELATARSKQIQSKAFMERQCEAFASLAHEHPALMHAVSNVRPRVVASISDFVSASSFRKTGMYKEHNRNVSGKDQVTLFVMNSSELSLAMSLYRNSEFNSKEKAVADILIFYLEAAYRRLTAISEIESKLTFANGRGDAWVEVGLDGEILALSPNFDSFVYSCLGCRINAARIPPEFRNVIKRIVDRGFYQYEASTPEPRTTQILLGTETIEFSVCMPSMPLKVVMRRIQKSKKPQLALLTRTEQEVACWIAKGKTNAEICALRGVSRRTVEKQVESILAKLGVKSRMRLISMVCG